MAEHLFQDEGFVLTKNQVALNAATGRMLFNLLVYLIVKARRLRAAAIAVILPTNRGDHRQVSRRPDRERCR